MADDLFGEKKEEEIEEKQEPEKIKLGDKEYTQDELSKLVGLGEFAQEVETKQNRKLDKIYPAYVEATQKLSELEKENEGLKQARTSVKAEEGIELSPEEVKKQALIEAKKLGLISVNDVNEYIDSRLAARDLQEDIEAVVELAKEEGKPEVESLRLVEHMQETGIRNPQKAYNDLFEKELDDWRQKQLDKVKKSGMVTETESTAGSKQHERVQPTRENLDKLIEEAMFRE